MPEAEVSKHTRRTVRKQVGRFTPEKVYDDPVRKDYRPELQIERKGLYVADLHGQTVHRLDTEDPNLLPRSSQDLEWDRIREICAQEYRSKRLQEAIPSAAEHILEVYLAFIDWEEGMLEDGGCTDDEQFAIAAHLLPTADGRLERGDDGWPIHGSYCFVAKSLHEWCPARFRNKKGNAMGQETAKKLVLNGLSKKLSAYVERRVPGTWPQSEIRKQLERKFGDESHRVPHQKAQE